MVKSSDLRVKDIVNINDGKRLGLISDLEVDMDKGQISGLILPGAKGILGLFNKDKDMVIPWARIKVIGADVILVDLPPGWENYKLGSDWNKS